MNKVTAKTVFIQVNFLNGGTTINGFIEFCSYVDTPDKFVYFSTKMAKEKKSLKLIEDGKKELGKRSIL